MSVLLCTFVAALSIAQPSSGTTASGLFFEVSGAGEPVVLVHAFSLDRRMWEPQVVALEKHFRVARYDLRGHGKSAAPSGPFTAYDDLREVLDTLKIDRATVVGLSAGSEIAINFALAYPARVSRLVLAAPGLSGYKTPLLPWFGPIGEAAAAGDAARAATLWAETPIMAMRSNKKASATVTSLVMSNSRLWTMKRMEQPLAPPAVDRLEHIKAPTLVIVGDQDLPHIREIGKLLADRVPGVRLVTIPGAGHIVNLDAPSRFNDAMLAFVGPSPSR